MKDWNHNHYSMELEFARLFGLTKQSRKEYKNGKNKRVS